MSVGNRGGASAPKLAQQQDSASQGQTSQQPTAGNQANTDGDKSQIALVPYATTTVSNSTQTQTEREEQRAEADLQAQQDMAFYALLMVIATVATVFITAVGVWFVKRTLDANLEFLKESQNATAAMVESNKQARIQTAPHLRVNSLSLGIRHVEDKGPSSTFSFNVKNFGTTAASTIKFRVHLYTVDVPKGILTLVGRKKINIDWLQSDSVKFVQDHMYIIDPVNCWDCVQASKGLVAYFRLTFVDIYGEMHEKRFCFQGEMSRESSVHRYIGEFDAPDGWVVKALRLNQ